MNRRDAEDAEKNKEGFDSLIPQPSLHDVGRGSRGGANITHAITCPSQRPFEKPYTCLFPPPPTPPPQGGRGGGWGENNFSNGLSMILTYLPAPEPRMESGSSNPQSAIRNSQSFPAQPCPAARGCAIMARQWGVAKWSKAAAFGAAIRWFESSLPSSHHNLPSLAGFLIGAGQSSRVAGEFCH